MLLKYTQIPFLINAISACHEANADQPFMCLDLSFIWILLEKGFGLNPQTRLYVSFHQTFLKNFHSRFRYFLAVQKGQRLQCQLGLGRGVQHFEGAF